MPTAIKICGLSTLDSLEATIAARATHVGFVFFPKSPRNISLAQAAALGAAAKHRFRRQPREPARRPPDAWGKMLRIMMVSNT